MSKKGKLVEELKAIERDCKDKEERHRLADNALLKYIDDPEVAEQFRKIAHWYS